MKIVFVVKYYDSYRASFYKRMKDLEHVTYEELVQRYLDDHFSFYSSLVMILRARGHEAQLVIPNCPVIREKWQENKSMPARLNAEQFILSVIHDACPDIIFLNSNFEYFGDLSGELRKLTKALCCWISCPYNPDLDLSAFSEIFTLFPPHHEAFCHAGYKSKLVTAGFDPAVLEKAARRKPSTEIDFSFIGGIGAFHKKREAYLKEICTATPIQLWGYGFSARNPVKKVLKNIQHGFSFSKAYRGQAWGMDMFSILGNSKITLNIHGDIADKHSVNMRLFEATGMGTLLLTDEGPDIAERFTPGVEIVTFKSPREAVEKYRYYITHEEERKKIAAAGQKKTLERYNYEQIAGIFINEFTKLISE